MVLNATNKQENCLQRLRVRLVVEYLEQNLIKMKELYNELLERETYLKGIEQTKQVQIRLSELMLVIVRVQQLILPTLVH